MIMSLVEFILVESEKRVDASIQIRKCHFFREELQKYSLAPVTSFHKITNNLEEENTPQNYINKN